MTHNSKVSTFKYSALAGTAMAAFMSVNPSNADAQTLPYNADLTFNMEVQMTPLTNPTNPDSRIVEVDCDELAIDPLGRGIAITGAFLDQFDLPPYRTPSGVSDSILDGAYAFRHLGGMTPENHQLCTGQASVYNNVKPDANGNVTTRSGHVVPLANDRFCAPIAAYKVCSLTDADDSTISDIWRFDDQGNMHLVSENL